MATDINRELISYLTDVHAIEQAGLRLLDEAARRAGDERIAEIYRTHRLQTEAHARSIADRLKAHDTGRAVTDAAPSGLDGIGIPIAPEAAHGSPARLAMATYAFENLEIAAYHLLRGVAQRAGDTETIVTVDRILEEEEEAAEILASTFDRVLEMSLGDRPGGRDDGLASDRD
jgi:ferritin-like metal-binding protein YciE